MIIHSHSSRLIALGALLTLSAGSAVAQQADAIPALAPTASLGTPQLTLNADQIRTSQEID